MGDVMLERDGSDDAAMDSAGSVSGKADSDVVVDCVCVCVDSGADDNDSKGWMVLWFVLWKEWLVLVRVCVWVWGDWNANAPGAALWSMSLRYLRGYPSRRQSWG